MSRRFILGVLFVFVFITASAQQRFTIKGEIKGINKDVVVLLNYYENGVDKLDSLIAKRGVFKFRGRVQQPVKATIELRSLIPDNEPMTAEKYAVLDKQEFFLENVKIDITGNSIKNAVIRGGKTQDDYVVLKSQLKPLNDKMHDAIQKMRLAYEQKNEQKREALKPVLTALRGDINTIEEDFIHMHNDSYVSMELLFDRSTIIHPNFEQLFSSLSEKMRRSPAGKELAVKINIAKLTRIGSYAIDFVQNNGSGDPVPLSSLRGKYVLLDFWASWCGPCRAENPNLIKVYQQFKDQNFEILAVSLDDKRDKWLEAIKHDGLPWINICDLKGINNAVALSYGISAIPQNFLIDPNGIIVAKNLRGEQLSSQLSSYLKKDDK